MAGKPHSSDTVFTGKKEVKQSNHDVYTIPPCMAPWADEPLYLVVARWGLQQKRWISRNDIAAVFHIPDRRASFQLSYISRKKIGWPAGRATCQPKAAGDREWRYLSTMSCPHLM